MSEKKQDEKSNNEQHNEVIQGAYEIVHFRKEYKDGKLIVESEEGSEEIAIRKYNFKPSTVHVGLGYSINLGDYNNAKVNVGITVPCAREEIEDAYQYADSTVTKLLREKVMEVKRRAKK